MRPKHEAEEPNGTQQIPAPQLGFGTASALCCVRQDVLFPDGPPRDLLAPTPFSKSLKVTTPLQDRLGRLRAASVPQKIKGCSLVIPSETVIYMFPDSGLQL